MDQIIKNVLFEMQYTPQENFYVELENVELLTIAPYIAKHEDSTCYLVCSLNESTLLQLDEKTLISEIAAAFRHNGFYIPDLDKNTSLILCVLKDQNAEKTKVYQRLMEDDPYYFKKHVLLFTEQEKVNFGISKENAATQSYLDYIETYLYNVDNFNNYKKDPDNNYLYQFITNLATKIPIIPLKNISKEPLPVISEIFAEGKKDIENALSIESCINLLLSDDTDIDDLDKAIDLARKLTEPYIMLDEEN